MSNWERDALNPDQIKYAAMDAWASLLAYRALKSIALLDSVHGAGYECEPLPEPVVSSEDEDEESEDYVEKEWEIPEGVFSHEQFTTEVNQFPIYLEAIDIKMNHTMDPKFWKITLYLGGDQY